MLLAGILGWQEKPHNQVFGTFRMRQLPLIWTVD